MKVLVTGGAGFIGSNIVDYLINNNHKVIVVDNMSTGKVENLNSNAEFYNLDIRSSKLENVFKENNITHVIHHAAQIDVQRSIQDPIFDAENNIIGTINLLNCCKNFNIKKIIYASSAAVYGEPDYLPIREEHPIKPMSSYGVTKYTPEHYIKMYNDLYGLKYTIFRYANVYGPRQDAKGEGGVISIFIDKMLSNEKPVVFGNGEQTRDFIYVYDIVKANYFALEKANNTLLNISTGKQNSVNTVIDYINNYLSNDLETIYKKFREGDIIHSSLDNNKAKEILDWEPQFSLKEGLKQTINYYKNN